MRLTELLSADRVGIQSKGIFQGSVVVPSTSQEFNKPLALSVLAAMIAPSTSVGIAEIEQVLREREALQSTGIGEGVAIPHGALNHVEVQKAALLIVPDGIDFDAIDSAKVRILFAVVGPKRATGEHLKTLARISRLLRNRGFREELIAAPSPESVYALIAREEEALS
jgi:PTS system nitrogen regulatory IIA component